MCVLNDLNTITTMVGACGAREIVNPRVGAARPPVFD
jgi:hypothetical protein